MKKLYFTLLILFATTYTLSAQSILELSPEQSMCVTGKGPGQDAAINSYSSEESIAVIENISKNSFSIRIQSKGEIIKTITVAKGKTKEIKLQKGYELYLDTELKAKAKVSFKKVSD